MNYGTELTKRLIANSFKELLLQNSFEKITIKMITDHANVIRPTFYNHFHDKYELLEWIFRDEVLDEAEIFEREGKIEEGIYHIFSKFYEDREFYRKAFEITGQNGFAEGSDASIRISGGEILVKASGDGIDSKRQSFLLIL